MTVVRLAYEAPVGEDVGSDPVLLDVLAATQDVTRSVLRGTGTAEALTMDLADGRSVTVTRRAAVDPDHVDLEIRSDDRTTTVRLPADPAAVAQRVSDDINDG